MVRFCSGTFQNIQIKIIINYYYIIIKNPFINNILSQNYFTFFNNVYYKSEGNINMEKYGLNKIFKLSNKAEMYADFIHRMKINILMEAMIAKNILSARIDA